MSASDVVAKTKGFLSRLLFEMVGGLDTTAVVRLADVDEDGKDRSNYIASGWATLRYLANRRPFTPDDVFVDFGSGKGRVIVLAATYRFKRVVGVELSHVLHEVAQANLRKARWRLTCQNVELANGDASEFLVPDDMTIAYMFNPFVGPAFLKLIENIGLSYVRRRRRIMLFYTNPVMHEQIAANPWLKTVAYQPGNVAIYETDG